MELALPENINRFYTYKTNQTLNSSISSENSVFAVINIIVVIMLLNSKQNAFHMNY